LKFDIKRGLLLKLAYPLLMLLGSVIPGKKESLQAFIIRLNNRLVLRLGIRTSRLLLLMPHCLQVDKCDIRLTHNVRNCKQCGKCGMKGLIEVSDRTGIELFVASGGNLARRIVEDTRPEAIIAVACERDLSSGIADVYPMPVYGVCNERPCGPCLNTKVDISKLENAIALFNSGPSAS
jgi:hypothetical protein